MFLIYAQAYTSEDTKKEKKRERKWKGKKPTKTQPSEKFVLWFLKAAFHSILVNVFHFRFIFFLHFTKIKIHYTLVHLIICTRFFYLMNTQFQSQMTCFQFNFHLFEMTSKYVEHQLHDYNILLNASNFRMVFLGLRVRYTIDISIKSCWTNQNKKKMPQQQFYHCWLNPPLSFGNSNI